MLKDPTVTRRTERLRHRQLWRLPAGWVVKGRGALGGRLPNRLYGREDSNDEVPRQPRLLGRGSGEGCVSKGVSGCADHLLSPG